MGEYLFVLGRDKDLALLELESVFSFENVKKAKGGFAVVDTGEKPAIERFGGITKIGKRINDLNEIVIGKDKLSYSVFGDKEIRLMMKKRFKEERVKGMFRAFSYEPGNVDIEIVSFDGKLFLIEGVSKPKEYRLRDELRPRFDAKKVISIRMAKMLINFSKAEKEIFDPFCGGGTILQEGLLRGLDVIGIDRSVNDARKNLNWLRKGFSIKNNFKLIEGDARELSKYVNGVECVVTEPYMGPYFRKLPSVGKGKRVIRSLAEMYDRVFGELGKIVAGRVVMIIPAIRTYKNILEMDFMEIASRHGFKLVKSGFVKMPVEYNMPKAKVLREIWVLEKLK